MSDGDRPYRILGWHLKLAREQLKESVAEVSGAVEIDTEDLERIEMGKKRPSEDILMLLINHLGLAEMEADSLWELAGYISKDSDYQPADNLAKLDARVMYTDLVHTTVNDAGVVMSFLQTSVFDNQPISVARVGMSKTQARHMLKLLDQAINQPGTIKTKRLPPKRRLTEDTSKNDDKNKHKN